MSHMWRPENSLWELFFTYRHLDSTNQTQVIRIGAKYLPLQNYLAMNVYYFLYT